jgi:adenylate cyclase
MLRMPWMKLGMRKRVFMNNNNNNYHIKMAAFQELQEALKIKRVNEELLEHLVSSIRWLVHYAKKNNITLPEKDRIMNMLDRATEITDKLPSAIPTEN